MHPAEVEAVLGSFEICVDTREQPTKQAEWRYAQFGCPWQREKLDFGDYTCAVTDFGGATISFADKVAVERKMSLDELCLCYTKDRRRFTAEFERAKAAGAKIYLLVETGSFEKAYDGEYRSQMRPSALIASIFTWAARYNCNIIMCSPKTSGLIIREILYREAKEYLLAL